MGYHPRIETSDVATFQTTRSRNSELWFVNNVRLERSILGYLAKYSARYEVSLYAFAIEGNHIQFPALFPKCNRAPFMRDLNSSIARALPRHSPSYSGGRLWQRRYSSEFLPAPEDIEEWFFYTVLQPVQDGLVEKLSQYPGYNCFHDAVHGIERKFSVVNWNAYNEHKRWNPEAKITDFTEIVTLSYKRLPGYEHLSQKEYAKLMFRKLEERRIKIVEERRAKGLTVGDGSFLRKVRPGALPVRTKTSSPTSHRPRVLSKCNIRRNVFKVWYFSVYHQFKEASARYLEGVLTTLFPRGTYRPPSFTRRCSVAQAFAA